MVINMVVKQNNIGDIICRYDNGERFAVRDVSDIGLSIQYEDGTYGFLNSRIVNGAIEQDEPRIASFQTNLALSRVLAAAEEAAARRFNTGQYDVIAQQNASRISDIMNAQRTHFYSRLQTERQTLKAGCALADQFLANLTHQMPNTNANFFDTLVQLRDTADHPVFRMNGIVDLDRYAAMVFLSDRTAAPTVPTHSFDALVETAANRATATQQEISSRSAPDHIKR